MRLLFEHCDHFKWEVKRKTRAEVVEEVNEGNKKGDIQEVLVVFITSEGEDDLDQSEVLEKASDAIDDVARKVKAKNIVLFPFVHLFPEGHPPAEFALNSMNKLYELVRRYGYNVGRVPFGWYKTHELKTKGHPLSILSRTVRLEPLEIAEQKPSKIRELNYNDYI